MSQYVSLCLENVNLLQVCKEDICFCYRQQHFSGCSLTSNALILLCDIAAQVKVQSIVLCLQYSQEILLAAPQQTTPASTTGRQLWLWLARQSISLDSAPLHCTLSRRIGPTSSRKQNTAVATTINKNVYHSGCYCLTTSFSDNNMQQTIYLWCNIQLGIQCDPFIAKRISTRLWTRDLFVCMYVRIRNTQWSCLGMSICAHGAPPACTCAQTHQCMVHHEASYVCVLIVTNEHALLCKAFCKNNLQCVGNPSCQQTMAASKSSQLESPHTLPQFLAMQISTLPTISLAPPTKRTSPLSHSAEIKNCEQHHTHDLTSGLSSATV